MIWGHLFNHSYYDLKKKPFEFYEHKDHFKKCMSAMLNEKKVKYIKLKAMESIATPTLNVGLGMATMAKISSSINKSGGWMKLFKQSLKLPS